MGLTAGYKVFNKKRKVGYSFGLMSESFLYNMFYTYYLAFLTDVAGLDAKVSGIIIFISIAWDAVTDPIIGYYTDKPGVDKRKVIKMSVIPMVLCFVAAWLNVGSVGVFAEHQWLKIAYYIAITMLLWLFYTFYTIPYYSVVPELSEDYDERTEIRSMSSMCNVFSTAVGNMLPAVVEMFAVVAVGWLTVAGILSGMSFICAVICLLSLKGVYLAKAEAPKVDKKSQPKEKNTGLMDTFRAYAQIIRLKPFIFFVIFVFCFLAGSAMVQANIKYSIIHCIGFDYETGTVIFILGLVISMAVTVAIVTKVAEKTDRRTAIIIFLSITVAGLLISKLIGLDHKFMVFVQPVVLGIGVGTFWTLFYSVAYDLVEIDEFVYGKRREGIITAFPQFVQKFGSGFGIMISGQMLSSFGYDEGKTQQALSAATITGIENISTLFPAILIAISLVGIILFPVTRERFELLKAQLEKKRCDEEYSKEGLEKLI